MNYSPQNEQGLLGLIQALKGGMDPSTAYTVFQNINQDQSQRIANRQARLGGLAELLMGAATSGMPYAGASALAEAAPGPAGPAVQQMLSSLYPEGDASTTNYLGHEMDFPQGSRPGAGPNPVSGFQYAPPGPPVSGPQSVSPSFVPQGPSVSEQLAVEQAQMEQQQVAADTAAWAQVGSQLSAAKAKGFTLEQAVAKMMANPAYAAVINTEPEQFQHILENVYGSAAVSMQGAPGLGG